MTSHKTQPPRHKIILLLAFVSTFLPIILTGYLLRITERSRFWPESQRWVVYGHLLVGFSQYALGARWRWYAGVRILARRIYVSNIGSICCLFLGKKPLSVFGLPHTLWETNIRKEWKEKLQGIDANQGLDAQDRVLLKLLRERLVDLGPLEGI